MSVLTNRDLSPELQTRLLHQATGVAAEILGKPQDIFMASVQAGVPMIFRGTKSPAVWIEIKGLGITADAVKKLAVAMSELAAAVMGIPEERVFFVAQDVPRTHWAIGKKTME